MFNQKVYQSNTVLRIENVRLKQIEALKQQAKMTVLPIPPALLKRIREAEMVIMEEAIMMADMEQSEVLTEKREEQRRSTSSDHSEHKKQEVSDTRTQDQPALHSVKKSPTMVEKEPVIMKSKQESPVAKLDKENFELKPEKKSAAAKEEEEWANNKDEEVATGPTLNPLGISESEVPEFLKHYESAVSPKLIQSYPPCSELLEKSLTGYEPHWLCFCSLENAPGSHSSVKGLAVFHMDPTSKLKPRVNILHATVTPESELKPFLAALVEYIWTNMNCEEIRVGIAHIDQAGEKSVPYEVLKAAYQELQFRWKTLTNDEQGKRILVLGLNRPATKPFMNPRYYIVSPLINRNLIASQEPITFKHAVVLSLSKTAVPEEDAKLAIATTPMGQCSYLSAALGLKLGGHIPSMGALNLTKADAFYSQALIKTLSQLDDMVTSNLL